MTGETISRYRVLEKLGEGGMGVVYKAEDVKLKRPVALKFMPKGLEEHRERFLREAQAAAALNHPNICTIHEIDDEHGFIAMELVEGKTLKDKIAERPLPLQEALDIAVQVCTGLQHAHEKGVVHRDIKPANIIVAAEGQIKIMDFGLAQVGDRTRITKTGSSIGTPAYMSPEQVNGKSTDKRTDLWSLGVTLYEMIAGRRPFAGETEAAVGYAIAHTEPESLTALRVGVPLELDRIVTKLLRKNPEGRYASAEDLRVDLRQMNVSAAKSGATWKRVAVAVGAAALLAVVVVTVLNWKNGDAIPAPSSYQQVTAFADSVVQPSLSPDGRMVTFIRGSDPFVDSGQVYVKLLPGGEPVQLTNDPTAKMSPVFSPDGARIVYTMRKGMIWDSWVVPVLGGEPKPFLANAAGITWTAPNQILFSEIIRGIHMKLVAATQSRTESRDVYVPDHERGMAHRSWLSPDGKSVLVAEMDSQGWTRCRVVPYDGSSLGQSVGPKGRCLSGAWTPDGKWIYYNTDASGAFQIWRQRFPSGTPQQITFGPGDAAGIAMAADGKSLLTSIGIEQRSIWLNDGTRDRQLTHQGSAALPMSTRGIPRRIFTPDGKKLFYLVPQGGSSQLRAGELWNVDIESGASEAVLPGLLVTGFDIEENGQSIVYAALDENNGSDVWIAPLDRSSAPRRLSTRHAEGPVFGPNGNVYYRSGDRGRNFLLKVSQLGGTEEKVWPEPVIGVPAISNDMRWLTAIFEDPARKAKSVLRAIPLEGGEPVDVCERCVLRWYPDGSAALIEVSAALAEGDAYVVPIRRGRSLPDLPPGGFRTQEALEALPPLAPHRLYNPHPAPRAPGYLYTKRTVQRNLYRIPLQ